MPTDPLVQKGAMFGLIGDLFRDFAHIINFGLAASPDADPQHQSFSERRDLELFQTLKHCVPNLVQLIAEGGPLEVDRIAGLLDKGRSSLRGTDIHTIKKAVASWRPFNPPIHGDNKDIRGFNHPECGALICPAHLDWEDPAIQAALRNATGEHSIAVPNFFKGLWRRTDVVITKRNKWDGFCENELLCAALRTSLYGQQAALLAPGVRIAARRPRAQTYRIRTITTGCIAYAAVMDTFSVNGFNNKYNYEKLYQLIVTAIDTGMPKDRRQALFAWWNRFVHTFSASVRVMTFQNRSKVFSAQYAQDDDIASPGGNNGQPTIFELMMASDSEDDAEEGVVSAGVVGL
ncbi:hypothetical protein BD309DRAFT_1083910 [Dichomitus squalens]|nr:hypothetical protein BD309DRAFT_1083910 [Dichomitus squalens]